MAVLLPFIAIAGIGMSAAGSIMSGEAEGAAADFNAQISRQNAKLSKEKAAEDERRYRNDTKKQLGDMRASYGASGVQTDGSPLDVLEESASTAELDALNIRHEGEVKAAAYHNEATLYRVRGANARTAGYMGAASKILGGAGDVFAAGKKAGWGK